MLEIEEKQVDLMAAVDKIKIITGNWIVLRLRDASAKVVNVIPGSKINMEITDNGNVSGKAGCNGYFCGLTITEGKVFVSPIGSTRMYCNDPGIMDQEMYFFRDLESARILELRESILEFREERGGLLISMERQSME